MKITIGNYTQVFDELAANFTRLEQSENNNVKETFKKINEKIKAAIQATQEENKESE